MQATEGEERRRGREKGCVPKGRLVLAADEISPVIISLSSRGKCIPRCRGSPRRHAA